MTEVSALPAAASGAEPEPHYTVPALWRRALAAGRRGPAYLVEEEPGRWREVSWTEAGVAVDELASGLLALGVRRGDAFAIIGRNALEWALFDFALGLVGAIPTPIYSSSSPADALFIARHSESVGALVENDEQRAKLDGFEGRASQLNGTRCRSRRSCR